MRRLTIHDIDPHRPCPEGRELFVRLFPKGTMCSKKDLDKMARLSKTTKGIINWTQWAALQVLNDAQWEVYSGYLAKHGNGEAGEGTIRAFGKAWRKQNG